MFCSLSEDTTDRGSRIRRRPSLARAFINRIRSSMHVTTSSSVAFPYEIQERFIFVVSEAVNLGTIFNKGAWVCESVIFGQELKTFDNEYLLTDEHIDGNPSSSRDADHIFCSSIFHFLLDAISVALVSAT